MPTFSIRDAAREAGVSKTSILRAIQSGRMSAPRKDDGGYAIDPAELFRVFPPKGPQGQGDSPGPRSAGQTVPPEVTAGTDHVSARLAALEAEVRGLRELLAEVRASRDVEREQHRMFMAALPPPVAPAPMPPEKASGGLWRPFWRRRVG